MRNALKAGFFYFSIVFAAGFLLGTLRVLVLVPAVGETQAVLVETPVILALSWFVSASLVIRCRVAAKIGPRLVMGAAAFTLLMLAEAGLSILAFGRSLAEHLASFGTSAGTIGLLGQIAYALFPALQLLSNRERSG
jgi:hypothetical protein